MKKCFWGIIILNILFVGCTSGAKPTVSSDGMTLDQAIAEAAIRIDERIAAGSKIAPLNFNSSSDRFSSYVLDELTAILVDSGKLTVVDRNEIDLIRSEFDFQYSGEVGDDSMQTLGQMLGAQSIISGSLTDMGGFYRIVIRVLNVQNASVEVQYRTNIVNDHIVTALITGGRSGGTSMASSGTGRTSSGTLQSPVGGQTSGGTTATSGGGQAAQPATQPPAQPTTITVEGASLAEKLQWLEVNAVNNTEYRIEVTGNESLSAPTLSYPRRRNITVRLISSGGERILSLTGNGSIFAIESDVTLILDNGITLQGRISNNTSLVRINSRGTLIINEGAKIIGNTASSAGGGVFVNENGNFTMTGGEISGNTTGGIEGGGGVYVNRSGNFAMTGGIIYGNKTTSNYKGGGVSVDGNFTMSGGEITGNTGSEWGLDGCAGGGVVVGRGATFRMSGGEIYGNNATRFNGGGVAMIRGTFIMTGGVISGNSAPNGVGGGVYLFEGTFTKTGGTIYGSTGSSDDNRASNGHAVASSFPDRIRNSTAGPEVRLDTSRAGAAGGWEN